MGLMDKFKNLFTDEEVEIEEVVEPVEIKEVKREEINQLPTFMREKLEKEKEKEEVKINNFNLDDEDVVVGDRKKRQENLELDVEKKDFKFPIDFGDDDFVETRSRHREYNKDKNIDIEKPREVMKKKEVQEEKKVKVADIYKDKREVKEEKKKFRATPIISPIYGVLDKNYSPVDVECNVGENFEKRRPSKSVDFDSVRKKAYGSLSEEIKENLMCENCEYLKEAKECKKREDALEENIVYEAMNNSNTNNSSYYSDSKYDDITLDEATENYYDYGVEYEKVSSNDDYYKPREEYIRLDKEEDEVIVNNNEEKKVKSIPPVKSSINLLSTLKKSMGDEVPKENKDLELTDDLFNLIDSMYDERND